MSRHARVGLVSVALCLLLVTMALAIVLSQDESRARTLSSFRLRAESSATFISTFVAQRTAHGDGLKGAGSLSTSTLSAFVDHAIPYREHETYLLDARGLVLAASPATGARTTLALADGHLARAVAHASSGSVPGARVASTFTVARVRGSAWRLVLAVPDSRLYASIGGWAERVPWIVFALVSLFGVSLVALFSRSLADHSKLAALSSELQKAAHTDHLTGLPNRRALAERLEHAAAHARREHEPMSVLMIDLDCFKQVNDGLGHEAGDRLLGAVASLLRQVFRASDICGRWGGDEFLVGLLGADEHGARAAAERLLQAARSVSIDGHSGAISLSIGIASGTQLTLDQLLQRADGALYESKARGRDRVTIASRSARAG